MKRSKKKKTEDGAISHPTPSQLREHFLDEREATILDCTPPRTARKDDEAWQLDWEPSERWKSLQLTAEQKAELRRRVQLDVDRARTDGVYERLAARRGQVKFALGWWETRTLE